MPFTYKKIKITLVLLQRNQFFQQEDGLSLLASVLHHWLCDETKCPRVLVSTHFHGLIRYNLLPESNLVYFQVDDGLAIFRLGCICIVSMRSHSKHGRGLFDFCCYT